MASSCFIRIQQPVIPLARLVGGSREQGREHLRRDRRHGGEWLGGSITNILVLIPEERQERVGVAYDGRSHGGERLDGGKAYIVVLTPEEWQETVRMSGDTIDVTECRDGWHTHVDVLVLEEGQEGLGMGRGRRAHGPQGRDGRTTYRGVLIPEEW
ncbi:MAG TPA: hypothetical protein VEU33_27800 [Archangium sp.]|nr:hypothetical protein [Archangium sp.]